MFSRHWSLGIEHLDVTALKLRHPTTHSASVGDWYFGNYDTVSWRMCRNWDKGDASQNGYSGSWALIPDPSVTLIFEKGREEMPRRERDREIARRRKRKKERKKLRSKGLLPPGPDAEKEKGSEKRRPVKKPATQEVSPAEPAQNVAAPKEEGT